jgi:hypothetical protein
MTRIKLWLIQFQNRRQERRQLDQLRRQWRSTRLRSRLQLLPLHLMLRSQLRGLEASAEAKQPKTDWSQGTPLENRLPGSASVKPLIRLRSLPQMVQLKRRLAVWFLSLLLAKCRQSLGSRGCSSR